MHKNIIKYCNETGLHLITSEGPPLVKVLLVDPRPVPEAAHVDVLPAEHGLERRRQLEVRHVGGAPGAAGVAAPGTGAGDVLLEFRNSSFFRLLIQTSDADAFFCCRELLDQLPAK